MDMTSQTVIEGKSLEITPAIREYVETKLERVHKHFDSLIKNHEIRVVLGVVTNRKGKKQKAEITIHLKGNNVIRSEDTEDDIYASIDLVIDKVEKQLRKYKTRLYSKVHSGKSLKHMGIEEHEIPKTLSADILEQVKSYESPKIIKTKQFKMEPLDPELALERLQDCGHPFYMFLNVFSNKIACVYKRDDGQYGMIEPEFLQAAT